MAQVNPANFGTNAVAIVGKQIDFDVQANKLPNFSIPDPNPDNLAKMRSEIVELRPPMTLQPVRGFYRADRMKGSPSPDPMVAGMQMGGGDINFFADPHTLPFWLAETLMYDLATSSVGNALFGSPMEVLAEDDYSSETSLADNKQPEALLAAHTLTVDGKTVRIPDGLRGARLIFTFSGDAVSTQRITITGTDHNDTPMTDIVSGALTADARVLKSNRWFKTAKIKVDSDLDVAVTIDPETYYHRLNFTKEVNEGLTMEVHEGNRDTPVTYAGGHIARGILSIEQVVRAMFRMSFNRAFPRQSITGTREGTALTTANGFTRSKPNFVPDWGMSWEILDGPGLSSELVGQHPLATGNFIIDNLLGPPATRFAESTTYPKNVRKGNRDLMLAVQVDHHKDLDFDQFVGGDSFQSVFSAVSRQFGQRYQAIRFSADNSQIVAFPSRPIMNLAEVLANLAIRMNIGDSAEGNDEATLEIFNDSATL